MKIGMLWFDNDSGTPLDKKILRAADYYRLKYGAAPSVCFVHPSMLAENEADGPASACEARAIRIRTAAWILPNHYWLGVNGGEDNGA